MVSPWRWADVRVPLVGGLGILRVMGISLSMWSLRLFWRAFLVLSVPTSLVGLAILLAMAGQEGGDSDFDDRSLLPFGILFVAAFIQTLGCYWLTRRISQGVGELKRVAEGIERGDFSQRAQIYGRDELALAATALNDMRDALAERLAVLQENRHRMETVLGGMVEGVLAVDAQQRVLLANDACRNLLGITTRDVMGRPLLEMVRNLDVQELVARALSGTESASREIQLVSAGRRSVRVLATRLAGQPCPGVVVVLHDVTDLRRLESLRRDFVANVSHELKTPLSAIKAYAETLRMGAIEDPEYNLSFVERIEEQATRLHQLIVDLLHLARVETGKEAFEFRNVSLSAVCQACFAQHAEVASSAEVSLEIRAGTGEAVVWADEEGVRVIADNLVNNAIKFTPAGGRVTLQWRAEDRFGILEVQDTGIGIAPQDRGRVFERFFRADKARSRDLGGTGLGLAIVKHLAQAFGGDVSLTSELGKGSTFQVRLPLA